ncbi:hypothetical protein MRS44_013293 [Fusarium solani]|uniref:uncharacterized protein n=1 Tax=Fusarium solani TaxID=169388 RepID=UPI0032C4AF32|nr:hypothetical protein MRS44_013293 [Fusarium solani]
MDYSHIEAWIAEASAFFPLHEPSSPLLSSPNLTTPTKRKQSHETTTIMSPPFSEDLPFPVDPRDIPRPESPPKKRRLDQPAAPKPTPVTAAPKPSIPFRSPGLSADTRSEQSIGGTNSFTGDGDGDDGTSMTESAPAVTIPPATSTSKKSGRRSPVRGMADLALAEKEIKHTILKRLDQLSLDVLPLFRKSKDASELREIVPREVHDAILADRGPLEKTLAPDTFYDAEAWAKEHRASPWNAFDELRELRLVCDRTQEAIELDLPEPCWNARIHERLLDVALKPFENLSHWDVTRATINKLYLGKHRSGVDLQAKLVDFCITLSGPTVRDVHNRLATANDPYSINHSSTSPLRYQPIAISIETKVRAGSEQESKAQLAVWATSHLKRLRLLSVTSTTHITVDTTLPLVQVNGGVWMLLFLRDGDGDEVHLFETVMIGDTKTVLGCYQVVAFLRHLGHWAQTVYKKWLYDNCLKV